MSITFPSSPVAHRRGMLLYTGLTAALGAVAIHLAPFAALWRMAWPYGLLFAVLGIAQLSTAGAVLVRPTRHRLQYAAAVGATVILVWLLVRWHVLAGPDPWAPATSVLGITAHLEMVLQIVATAVFLGLALYGPRPRPRMLRRVLRIAATIPLSALVLLFTLIGVLGATNGFAGAGFPSGTVAPHDLPAAGRSVVEYCRPDGVRLAMDVYTPAASAPRPAPVALYVHGGAMVLGDRRSAGFGAVIANSNGALFTPLQRVLNDRGFVVASIDYRLLPEAQWPAPLTDAKCAVRFLRAHAAGLGIDPNRIAVWGSSGGGQLVTQLGLAGPDAGFDVGQYANQSSGVQAVVDMFGPTDFTDFGHSSRFGKTIVQIGLGSSTATRRSASPLTYVRAGAPPILILHGTLDPDIPIAQSRNLARQLTAAGNSVTLIEVQGTGHTVATPGEKPSAAELTTTVADFITTTLSGEGRTPGA
jgi:acetyl esterase/lipase